MTVLLLAGCTHQTDPIHDYVETALDLMGEHGYFVDANWPAQASLTLESTRAATETSETYGALILALHAAGGAHSQFIRPSGDSSEETLDPAMPTVSAVDGIGILTLPSINTTDVAAMSRYADVGLQEITKNESDAGCGWIVDLRGNPGGSFYPMVLAAAPLISGSAPVLYFKHRQGDSQSVTLVGGEVQLDGKTVIVATQKAPAIPARVAVLQDAVTASAAEAVLVSFAGQKDVVRIGQPSAGFTTGNEVFDLPDGAKIALTTSVYIDRLGEVYPSGVAPDVVSAGAETQISVAREWLSSGC